ncbi:MAG: hypothetical protein JO212_17035 [Acetobacteraceae bacterium]|nr:hypothetical protein [Acetobacteraceae bacterium]
MIRVDGVTIPEDLISLEAQLQDAPDPVAAWEVAARGLVYASFCSLRLSGRA